MVGFAPVIGRGFWGVPRIQTKLNFARIGWTEVLYFLFRSHDDPGDAMDAMAR
jgi:hypothetical protein